MEYTFKYREMVGGGGQLQHWVLGDLAEDIENAVVELMR